MLQPGVALHAHATMLQSICPLIFAGRLSVPTSVRHLPRSMSQADAPAATATMHPWSSSPPPPVIDLSLMYPRMSAADQMRDLATYLDLHADDAVSVPSFPPPQVLSNDPLSPPPVWPAWDRAVPPCTFPLATLQQPAQSGAADLYGGGAHLAHFEAHVANLMGKHAAMFAVSGTMSQLIALRIHAAGRNRIFACHPKCHIVNHEANVRGHTHTDHTHNSAAASTSSG